MTEIATEPAAPPGLTRSLSLEVFAPPELRQAVINSVRRYRACCREVYATLLLAQTAGATVEHDAAAGTLRVNPDSDRARQVLSAATGKGGKALAYELREYVLRHLWPTALSFVWDSCRRDVVTVWQSKDPEFTRANRGWLALQGARGVAQFNWRGIGFPAATGRPKLAGHALTLKWDHDLGAVEFALPKLDGGRWHVWRNLRDEAAGWSLGTLWLNERDGQLRATVSYTRPAQDTAVDPARTCRVALGTGETFLSVAGPDGATTFDTVSDAEAVAWLARMAKRKIELERRRAACGNPRRPWGHRKGWLAAQDVLSRLTLARERGVADRNHAWSRRVIVRALAWRCGRVEVAGLPKGGGGVDVQDTCQAEPLLLGGHPWKWSQFKDFLKYKGQEHGIAVEIV